MRNLKLLSLFVILIIGGCQMKKQTIPPGKYVAKKEFIFIKASSIMFHIRLEKAPPNVFWDKNLKYNITPQGQIISHTLASAEYVKTLAPFDWKWDGKNIIKISKKTGNKVFFRLQVPNTHENP